MGNVCMHGITVQLLQQMPQKPGTVSGRPAIVVRLVDGVVYADSDRWTLIFHIIIQKKRTIVNKD